MFDLNTKSVLKTAKFGLGVTILVLATACSHEVVQQPPIDTSANSGVENIPDATPTPEPSQALASPLDNGGTPMKQARNTHSKKSHRHHHHTIAKASVKSHHSGNRVARKIVKSHSTQQVAAYKAEPVKQTNENVVNMAAAQPPVPPAPTPAAIGSVGDGNLGTVDINQNNDGGFFSGLLGYWPYGVFALVLAGGLFFATKGTRSKSSKRGSLIFNS